MSYLIQPICYTVINEILLDADENGWKADFAQKGTRFLHSTCPSTEIYKMYVLSDKLQHVPSLCDSGSQHLGRRSFFSAVRVLIFNIVVYFMSGLYRSAGAFFTFHLFNYIAYLVMQGFFIIFGSSSAVGKA